MCGKGVCVRVVLYTHSIEPFVYAPGKAAEWWGRQRPRPRPPLARSLLASSVVRGGGLGAHDPFYLFAPPTSTQQVRAAVALEKLKNTLRTYYF